MRCAFADRSTMRASRARLFRVVLSGIVPDWLSGKGAGEAVREGLQAYADQGSGQSAGKDGAGE